jgi:hypothetical protein
LQKSNGDQEIITNPRNRACSTYQQRQLNEPGRFGLPPSLRTAEEEARNKAFIRRLQMDFLSYFLLSLYIEYLTFSALSQKLELWCYFWETYTVHLWLRRHATKKHNPEFITCSNMQRCTRNSSVLWLSLSTLYELSIPCTFPFVLYGR